MRTKKDTPSVVIKEASPVAASSVKNPLTKNKSVVKKGAKKLHFSPEVETMVRVLRTRASAKRFPLDPTPAPVQVVESESRHGEIEVDERDQKIKDFQDQFDKAHVTIAYMQQENRELRHEVSQETVHSSEGKPSKKTSVHADKGKSKQVIDVE